MICFSKIRLCATSHNCIFWVLDNFYCHKNFIGSYYTLYTIFYNSFYVPNIIKIHTGFYCFLLVMTETEKNWLRSQFFDISELGNRLPVFGSKNRTGPNLQTLSVSLIALCLAFVWKDGGQRLSWLGKWRPVYCWVCWWSWKSLMIPVINWSLWSVLGLDTSQLVFMIINWKILSLWLSRLDMSAIITLNCKWIYK